MAALGVDFGVFGSVGLVGLLGADCCLDLEWSCPLLPYAGGAFLVESRCPLVCASLDLDLLLLLDLDLDFLEGFLSLVKGNLWLCLGGAAC